MTTVEDPPQPQCPDTGTCHHRCLSGCWRVLYAGPLSGVFPDNRWPANIRRSMGALVQDGIPTPHPTADLHWGSRALRVLAFLHRYVAEHGYPPTLREVGDEVGLTSASSVAHQLQVLEARGYIARDPGSPRAITLLTPAPATEETHAH